MDSYLNLTPGDIVPFHQPFIPSSSSLPKKNAFSFLSAGYLCFSFKKFELYELATAISWGRLTVFLLLCVDFLFLSFFLLFLLFLRLLLMFLFGHHCGIGFHLSSMVTNERTELLVAVNDE